MRLRAPRDRRRPGVRVVLGVRDKALLRALARLRLAATDDLMRLFFWNVRRDTAAARLRRLHDGGLIQARVEGLNRPNLYHLGPEGVRWVEEEGLPAHKPPAGSSAHHLALVRTWTRLAAALRAHAALRLTRFEPDGELRSRLAGLSPPVIPDAVVEIRERASDAMVRFALEIDLSTERPETLRRKLAAYDLAAYFPPGVTVGLVVVLVGAGPRRLAAVRELVGRGWSAPAIVCGEADWPAAVLQGGFEAPRTSSPSREGRAVAASHCVANGSASQGEEPSR